MAGITTDHPISIIPIAKMTRLVVMMLTVLNTVGGHVLNEVILERGIAVAQCRLQCLTDSGLSGMDGNGKILCQEDAACGSCWSECFKVGFTLRTYKNCPHF